MFAGHLTFQTRSYHIEYYYNEWPGHCFKVIIVAMVIGSHWSYSGVTSNWPHHHLELSKVANQQAFPRFPCLQQYPDLARSEATHTKSSECAKVANSWFHAHALYSLRSPLPIQGTIFNHIHRLVVSNVAGYQICRLLTSFNQYWFPPLIIFCQVLHDCMY